MHSNKYVTAGMACLIMFGVVGCGSYSTGTSDSQLDTSIVKEVADKVAEASKGAVTSVTDLSEVFSDRDLDPSYDESEAIQLSFSDTSIGAESDYVEIIDHTVTLTKGGTYVLSGTSDNTQVVIDADGEKIQLVLNNVQLSNDSAPVLYVKNADKVFVTTVDNSVNIFNVSGAIEADEDNNLDGAIFFKSDLTINGNGMLNVVCETGHGIVVKDDLVLASNVSIEAANHAVQVKGSLGVHHGSYIFAAGKDALHAEDSDSPTDAFVYILDGTFKMSTGSDGIDAGGLLQIDGGEFVISAEDDGMHSESDVVINGGNIKISKCSEGIEGATVTINDGDIDVVSSDDGINAVGVGTTGNTDTNNSAGNEPDASMEPPEGKFGTNPPNMNTDSGDDNSRPEMVPGGPREGFEAPAGDQNGAVMDGVPVRHEFGGGGFGSDDSAKLVINGGTIHLDVAGDGLDSNGSLEMTGGYVTIDGPTNDGNAALDYGDGRAASITGGTIVAVGGAGMAVNFTDATQGTALISLGQAAEGTVKVSDTDGKELISFDAAKAYTSVLVSSPDMVENGTYTISCGDTSQDVTLDGYLYGTGGMGGRLGENPYGKVRHG